MMSIQPIPMNDPTLTRWLIASGVLLASAFVLANDDTRLEVPPAQGEILSDDIYERAEGWRELPTLEGGWREPKPQPKSRINFGYDSTYEELRARDDTGYSSKPLTVREPVPSTQFRLGF